METAENRFAHLLQPIRELTQNWNIDVASELNDYLEELDELCIAFDGGEIKLNFAEAALLIQGSAFIYSKKVELLYSLVYQTLDYINNRNKKRNKQAAASGNDDGGETTVHHDADDDADFKLLESDNSGKTQEMDSNMFVHVAPLPPESLIPAESHEKQKLPLISLKGEVLGSQKDFRMNTFVPGDEHLIYLISRGVASNLIVSHQHINPQMCFSPPQHQDAVVQAAQDGDVCSDYANESCKGEENFIPVGNCSMEMDDGPEEHIERHQASREGRMLCERRDVQPSEDDPNKQRREEERKQAENMWRLHDPFTVLGENKPLKKGKCYKVPDGLDVEGKRKRTPPSSLEDFTTWLNSTFNPPEHKLKNGPTFTDLNYIYLSTMKDKIRTRTRILRKAGVAFSEEGLRRTFLEPGMAEGLSPPDLQDDDNSDDEHEPLPDDIPAEFAGGQEDMQPEGQIDAMSYEDFVRKSVEQYLLSSQGYAQETALSRRVKDWEDKIGPVLASQEERPVFDIHDYGDRVVGAIGGVGQRKSFASIVRGLDNFEVCKHMLASLQLANDYTVEIDCAEGLEESVDTMGLTLLSTHRATERFTRLNTQVGGST
ncbi:condensin-2 complex subunit H2 [Lampris incognitus]|uniref:condensin-2 complex subunit H2 n=1 Tax=Lampris incognitus TaxID=2546036 RepID=UPI0024B4E711|nr:condensin-2 complex subunit H2 [Lampris incognitus]